MAALPIKFKALPIDGNDREILVKEETSRSTGFSAVMPKEIGLLLTTAPEMKMLLLMLVTSIELNEKNAIDQIIKQAKILIEGTEKGEFLERLRKDG